MKTSPRFVKMKKALLGGITFLIAAFLLTSYSATAQTPCLPGTIPIVSSYTDPISGCTYDFTYCLQCSTVATSPWGLISNLSITIPSGCPPPSALVDYNIVMDIFRKYTAHCNVAPCGPEDCTTVEINFPLCLQWMQYGNLDENNQYQYTNYMVSCDQTAFCTIMAKFCVDAGGNAVECDKENWTYSVSGTTCPTTPQPAPIRPVVDFLGSRPGSSCWQYRTCP